MIIFVNRVNQIEHCWTLSRGIGNLFHYLIEPSVEQTISIRVLVTDIHGTVTDNLRNVASYFRDVISMSAKISHYYDVFWNIFMQVSCVQNDLSETKTSISVTEAVFGMVAQLPA